MTIKKKSIIVTSIFLIILFINSIGTFLNTNEIKKSSALLNYEITTSSKLTEIRYLLNHMQKIANNIALTGQKDTLKELEKAKKVYTKIVKELQTNSINKKDKTFVKKINKQFNNYYSSLLELSTHGIKKLEITKMSKSINQSFNKTIITVESSLRAIGRDIPSLEKTKLKLLIIQTKEMLTNALVVATKEEVKSSTIIKNAMENYINVVIRKFPDASEKLQVLKKDYLIFYEEGHKLALKGVLIEDRIKAIDHTLIKVNKIATKEQQVIENIVKEKQKELKETISTNDKNISTMQFITVLYSIFFLVGILFLAFMLKNTVSTINRFRDELLQFFKFLNNESDDIELLDDKSKDEFADMAKVVNTNIIKTRKSIEENRILINETIDVLKEYEYGNFSPKISVDVEDRVFTELKNVLNHLGSNMENNINNILNILEEYSNYDYRNRIDTKNLKNHLNTLASGVNELGESTVEMLKANISNGETLQENAQMLSSNVVLLNNSASQQAASLEETSAALEELTSTVQNNSDVINEVYSYSKNLTESIKKGYDLANKTVHSMQDINDQTKSISEAIIVIDQIAFQTNILSLNAAVEAATAGEAGKGFAVVAQEVRNLASRSAEAAQEIKALVEAANVKTSDGIKTSDEMITGYDDLSENIKKTIVNIETITQSANEQQSGIEQINDAIALLDKETQKNAASANETEGIAQKTENIAASMLEDSNKSNF